MNIQASTEEDLIELWSKALVGLLELQERERQVLHQYLLMYYRLEESGKKLKLKSEKEQFDPMNVIRKPEILRAMCENLDMDFDSFRMYTKKLSGKGFFANSTIDPKYRVTKGKVEVVIEVNDGRI